LSARLLLHLVAGVSYYSRLAAASPIPRRGAVPVGGFLQELYVHGLAEFSYLNRWMVGAYLSRRK
jgi:hypothetical protein